VDLALADRVHDNLMQTSAWIGETRGGSVHRDSGELFFASASEMPFLNGVMRQRSGDDADRLLGRAKDFFFSRRRGFVVFTWPGDPPLEHATVAAGMTPVLERYPEMVCTRKLDRLPGDVEPVTSDAGARAYWEVCEGAYASLGFPPGVFAAAFTPEELLLERVWACLARDGGRPVACALAFMTPGVGMIGWVAALPEARGKGLAAACTVAATNEALRRGADVVSLQASVMGEDLYRRLGYEELFSYRLLGAMPG
jgi:GNAT superfamily N-acetyltransferase